MRGYAYAKPIRVLVYFRSLDITHMVTLASAEIVVCLNAVDPCAGQPACMLACDHGMVKDENGCDTCECAAGT